MTDIDQKASPNWEAVGDAIECPLCEYNLRGLTQPQCPECGFEFSWSEVLDPNRRKHPYLFEHHAKRNSWSFLRTIWGGLFPGQFWRTLHPAQPSRPWRLVFYVVLILFFAALPAVLSALLAAPAAPGTGWPFGRFTLTWRQEFTSRNYAEFPWMYILGLVRMDVPTLLPRMLALYLLLPVLMYVFLLIFRATMKRVRVRKQHVLRCIIYSSDVIIWPAIALSVMVIINSVPAFVGDLEEPIAWTLFALLPLLWIVMTWRLAAAYRLYLRFDHPLATVISIQIILLLLYVFLVPVAAEL